MVLIQNVPGHISILVFYTYWNINCSIRSLKIISKHVKKLIAIILFAYSLTMQYMKFVVIVLFCPSP